ncbi:hypothetical protein ACHAPJ_000845 [Fusarium lateritium]
MAAAVSFAAQPEMAEVSNTRQTIQTPSPAETQQIIRRINAAYDWTGPDDPDDPRNFPVISRVLSIASISALALASCFAGAIYAPSQEAVGQEFNQGRLAAVLPLSLYNLGMACGPLVGAPLSETYGRKTVYVATTPIFVAFLLGSGFAKNIVSLSVCRFFAGMFASPNVNNTSATIMDYSAPQYRGASLGITTLSHHLVQQSDPSLAVSSRDLSGGNGRNGSL